MDNNEKHEQHKQHTEAIYLSIIIPAYNEEKRLPATLQKITEYIQKLGKTYEIIIVDDGSKDKTAEATKGVPHARTIIQPKNAGKGAAVKTGMLAARGELRLFCDADHSTPITELEKFLPLLNNYDVVIGSRAMKDSNIQLHQPFYRELMGKTFNKIVRLLTVHGIHDTQCGFKLFTKKAAEAIFPKQTINRFGFDVEILFLAQKYGFKIKEVPVIWINDTASSVRPIVDAYRMFTEVVRIRINAMRGKY